jgi:energy-coupling factor transport system permease protein
MKSMTLYVDRHSLIHEIDPITKIIYVLLSVLITYIISDYKVVLVVATISLGVLLVGKVLRKIIPIIGLSLLLIISMIIVQGIFHPENVTPLFNIGKIVFYKEGMEYALLLTLRVINMLSAFGVLVLTTKPDELIETLIQKGMSPKFGYVFLSVLQIIPQMRVTMEKITDAQRSRGMETEGNLWVRVKAFFPLIGPVVLSSLNETRERAIALEVRGFNAKGKKTFLNVEKEYPYRKKVRAFIIIVFLCMIIWRFFL